MLKSLYDVLQATDGESKSFHDWGESVADFVVKANGFQTRTTGLCFQKFCDAVDAASPRSAGAVSATSGQVQVVIRKALEVQQGLLPKVFKTMTDHFRSSNLETQDWFKAAVKPDALIPDEAARDVLSRAATFDLPCQELSCVAGVAEALKRSKVDCVEQTVTCRKSYAKSALLQGLCSARYAVLMRSWKDNDKPSPEELNELLTTLEHPVQTGIINGMLQLQKIVGVEELSGMQTGVKDVLVPVLGDMLKHFTDLLNEASRQIPSNYEAWIVNRQIGKIKTELFNRAKHDAVCGNLELQVKSQASLQRFYDGLNAFAIVPTADLTHYKTACQTLKGIRVYSATIHGLNVLLNRLAKETHSRNKAALVREHLDVASFAFEVWKAGSYGFVKGRGGP